MPHSDVAVSSEQPVTVTDLDETNAKHSDDHDDKNIDNGVASENVSGREGRMALPEKGKEQERCNDTASVKSNLAVAETEYLRRTRFLEKLVFIISVSTVVILALSLMNIHWFLPYYYAISMPALLVTRIVMYWKNKWQYFLIDFCYFANIFCYLYIWSVPRNAESSTVLFAISNGPLAWATVMFRNALAFHDVDRMTSCYIHILPMALSFGLRWYPEEMSLHWYSTFNSHYSTDIDYMFVWVFAVPLACFVLHSCLYLLIVYGICKPDESYLNSLRYLASRRNSWQGKTLYACGEKCIMLTYTIFNLLYSTMSLLLAVLFYKYFIAHVIYISLIMLIVTWNGATFYMDVLAVKGFNHNS